MSTKKALITGIAGQDGSYLAEQLLSEGFEVHGLVRRNSRGNGALENIRHLLDEPDLRERLVLHRGDVEDASSIFAVVGAVKPDELYNLAAQADVMESNFQPTYTISVNGNGVVNVLEAVRQLSPKTRVYQASTSELFGRAGRDVSPQDEDTKMLPQSPYSIGKLAGFHAVRLYREAYGIFAANGILFNHESPRRGDDYLTRKVTKAVARIVAGKQKRLRLGNLSAFRDWGYAPRFVEAATRILRHSEPDDFVIGTGETHTVEEWVAAAFATVDLNWKDYVDIDKRLYRPAEVDVLKADYSKAKRVLGWEPQEKFADIVKIMVEADLKAEGIV